MSNYWTVKCKRCDSRAEIRFTDQMREEMHQLAERGLLLKSVSEAFDDPELTVYFHSIPLGWFREHGDHELVAVDEYGREDTECGKSYRCPHCLTYKDCKLPRGHEGACSANVAKVI